MGSLHTPQSRSQQIGHRTLSSNNPHSLSKSPRSNERFLVGEIQSLKEAIVDLYLAIKIRSAEEVRTLYFFRIFKLKLLGIVGESGR